MEALGARIVHVYGLTETYGPFSVCAWPRRVGRPARRGAPPPEGAAGRAFSIGGGVRVIDDGRDVAADGVTMGEIMRGNGVMAGYLDDPEATAGVPDGWFHSGDGAVMHPDGYVEVRDRFKDVIISGGENISTIEVEQALVRHPRCSRPPWSAVPHDHWGERPKAFVTLAPGRAATTPS